MTPPPAIQQAENAGAQDANLGVCPYPKRWDLPQHRAVVRRYFQSYRATLDANRAYGRAA